MSKTKSMKYDNFWYNLWVSSKLTSKELSKNVGVTGAAIRNWFYGKYMPSDVYIERLCSIFSVYSDKVITPAMGKIEFEKAYCKYHDVEYLGTIEATDVISSNVNAPEKSEYIPEMPQDNKAIDSKYDDALRLLYNSIDFDTFMKVASILRG